METNKLQATQKQSNQQKNKTDTLELTNQEHNDLWTTHNTNARVPNKKNGILHAQEH